MKAPLSTNSLLLQQEAWIGGREIKEALRIGDQTLKNLRQKQGLPVTLLANGQLYLLKGAAIAWQCRQALLVNEQNKRGK